MNKKFDLNWVLDRIVEVVKKDNLLSESLIHNISDTKFDSQKYYLNYDFTKLYDLDKLLADLQIDVIYSHKLTSIKCSYYFHSEIFKLEKKVVTFGSIVEVIVSNISNTLLTTEINSFIYHFKVKHCFTADFTSFVNIAKVIDLFYSYVPLNMELDGKIVSYQEMCDHIYTQVTGKEVKKEKTKEEKIISSNSSYLEEYFLKVDII